MTNNGDAGGNQLNLLLVEDSPADAFLVREAIRKEGVDCHLEIAIDGEVAIDILDRLDRDDQTANFNLLLLDLNIPRRDGTYVLERLRRSKRCSKVPVIMISSSDSPRDRQRAADLGVTEYFRKPSSLKEFMQLGKIIRRVCEAAAIRPALIPDAPPARS